MGQGTYTGMATLVAEELDADWEQVRVEGAPADAKRYRNLYWGEAQGTGGSTAIANSWTQMRQAGAAADEAFGVVCPEGGSEARMTTVARDAGFTYSVIARPRRMPASSAAGSLGSKSWWPWPTRSTVWACRSTPPGGLRSGSTTLSICSLGQMTLRFQQVSQR